MNKFNFGEFIKIAHKSLEDTSANEFGYDFLCTAVNLMIEEGENIQIPDHSIISKFSTHVKNPANKIIDFYGRPKNQKMFADEIKIQYKNKLNLARKDTVRNQIKDLYSSDPEFAASYKHHLNSINDDLEFLAYALTYAIQMENVKDNVNIDLLSPYLYEAGYACPKCNKHLLSRKNKITADLTYIYYQGYKLTSTSSININDSKNKIILCPNCHREYTNNPTDEEYNHLLEIKKRLLKKKETADVLGKCEIRQDLAEVINDIDKLNLEEKDVELKTKPIPISNKIKKENNLLKMKVSNYVSSFFIYIKNRMAELKKNKFKLIGTEIRNAFLELNELDLTQDEIVANLTDWLNKKLYPYNDKRICCEIIVCYFIQNCEVFDEIA